MSKQLSILSISTVLPRPCGIATFNQDVTRSLQPFDVEQVNIAMERGGRKYAYPTATVGKIRQEVVSDYHRAAVLINKRGDDVVLLQHEFGIFGGWEGEYILHLLRDLSVPVVAVIHRYELAPDTEKKRQRIKIMLEIARHARAVLVISDLARKKMEADFFAAGISTPVIHIPHGTPTVADYILEDPKREVLGKDKAVVPTLATFGLIGEHKGIQDIVEVMPDVVRRFPTALYRVLGRPHPADARAQAFLRSVKERVKQLGLEKHVSFVTRFLSVQDIMENLQATDIYITFYSDPDQTSSGTLAFALAAGCCVVATPYIHARELLADGRGVLVPFQDRRALTGAITALLGDEKKLQACRSKALVYGRTTAWPLVGKRYLDVLRAVAAGKRTFR